MNFQNFEISSISIDGYITIFVAIVGLVGFILKRARDKKKIRICWNIREEKSMGYEKDTHCFFHLQIKNASGESFHLEEVIFRNRKPFLKRNAIYDDSRGTPGFIVPAKDHRKTRYKIDRQAEQTLIKAISKYSGKRVIYAKDLEGKLYPMKQDTSL